MSTGANSGAVAIPQAASIIEEVIAKGDLGRLTAEERARYYAEVCRSIGVNPLTKPFDYITLNNKLTLYATKTATDQLRTVRGVSIFRVDAETTPDGMRLVTAYARDKDGREDMDIGAVNVKGLAGEALANAYMKALTKAKRRVTLSICGLGWLDESELDAVPSARAIAVNVETGEIIEPPVAEPPKRERGTSVNTVPAPAPEPDREECVSWTAMWNRLKARNIDADAFESVVGKRSNAFPNPQAALDALAAAEAAIAAEQAELIPSGGADRWIN